MAKSERLKEEMVGVPAADLGYVARVRKVAETTIDGKRIIIQELLPWFGHIPVVLQAKEVGTNHMIAFASFETRHLLSDARPDWLEFRQIKVLPQYRKSGFAGDFLDLVCHLAAKAKVPLVLKPEPTSEKPLSEEELARWYQRHGFREFTKEEKARIGHAIFMHRVDQSLLFAGFEHKTGEITGPKVYSISREVIEAMNLIPQAKRIALAKKLHAKERGILTWPAYVKQYFRFVTGQMIREPSKPVNPDRIKRFKFALKYRLPDRKRIERAGMQFMQREKNPEKDLHQYTEEFKFYPSISNAFALPVR